RRTPFTGGQFPGLPVPPLGEQPLRKIHPLRQFRHLVPQLFQLLEQCVASRTPGQRPSAAPQPLGERLAHRREGDHPGEEAAHGDDGNQQRDHAFHDSPPLSAAMSSIPGSTYAASPPPPAPCAGTAPCTTPSPAPPARGFPRPRPCPRHPHRRAPGRSPSRRSSRRPSCARSPRPCSPCPPGDATPRGG